MMSCNLVIKCITLHDVIQNVNKNKNGVSATPAKTEDGKDWRMVTSNNSKEILVFKCFHSGRTTTIIS